MKLFEIKGLEDGVKVRRKCWGEGVYVFFNRKEYLWYEHNELFLGEKTQPINKTVIGEMMFLEDWEVYKEPKEKKRFWIWTVKLWQTKEVVKHTDYYYDDDGNDSRAGYTFCPPWDDWHKLEKIKHENEYIDIEVDWEG